MQREILQQRDSRTIQESQLKEANNKLQTAINSKSVRKASVVLLVAGLLALWISAAFSLDAPYTAQVIAASIIVFIVTLTKQLSE